MVENNGHPQDATTVDGRSAPRRDLIKIGDTRMRFAIVEKAVKVA